MIEAVYFPFTYLSPNYYPVLKNCFETIRVLQLTPDRVPASMRTWADEDPGLKIDFALAGEEERLAAMVREFEQWAALHDAQLATFKDQLGQVPYCDENSPLNIKAAIKQIAPPATTGGPTDDSDRTRLMDGVLLTLAQQFDQAKDSLSQDLQTVASMQADLARALHGDPAVPADDRAFAQRMAREDWGQYNTRDRLKACLRLWATCGFESEAVPVFVTPSRAVFDTLGDENPDMRILGEIPAGEPGGDPSRWRRTVSQELEQLALNAEAATSLATALQPATTATDRWGLTLALLPDMTPAAFMAAAGAGDAQNAGPAPAKATYHTLIGCLR